MSFSRSLKAAVARWTLGVERLAFERIFRLQGPLLRHLATLPRYREQVRAAILDNPELAGQVARDLVSGEHSAAQVRAAMTAHPDFVAGLMAEPAVLQAVTDALLGDMDAVARLARRLTGDAATAPVVGEALAAHGGATGEFLDALIAQPGGATRVRQAIERNTSYLTSLVSILLSKPDSAAIARSAIVRKADFLAVLLPALLEAEGPAGQVRQAIGRHPRFAASLVSALLHQPDGIAQVRRAIALRPEVIPVLWRGLLHDDAAAAKAREVIGQEPEFARSVISALLGSPEGASMLRRAIELRPESVPVILRGLMAHGETAAKVREVIGGDAEFIAALLSGLLSRPEQAEWVRRAIELKPEALSWLITAFLGNPETAPRVRRAIELKPEFATAVVEHLAEGDAEMARLIGRRGYTRVLAEPSETADTASTTIRSRAEFYRLWSALAPYIDASAVKAGRAELQQALSRVYRELDIWPNLLNLITHDDLLLLVPAPLRFPNALDLPILLTEILINEEYYFETDDPAPRILDGGSNFGLSLYYLKRRFPGARITGFEPLPAARDIAEENIKRQGWSDVEVLPFGLSHREGASTFFEATDSPMGSSFSKRMSARQFKTRELEVRTHTLSRYLDEPVDFLKLDIEGAEDRVLAECGPKLAVVKHLFCEFHYGVDLPQERLAAVLSLLDGLDFEVRVDQSYSGHRAGHVRPSAAIALGSSLSIWARRREVASGRKRAAT